MVLESRGGKKWWVRRSLRLNKRESLSVWHGWLDVGVGQKVNPLSRSVKWSAFNVFELRLMVELALGGFSGFLKRLPFWLISEFLRG